MPWGDPSEVATYNLAATRAVDGLRGRAWARACRVAQGGRRADGCKRA